MGFLENWFPLVQPLYKLITNVQGLFEDCSDAITKAKDIYHGADTFTPEKVAELRNKAKKNDTEIEILNEIDQNIEYVKAEEDQKKKKKAEKMNVKAC